jgi:hypothetical protein
LHGFNSKRPDRTWTAKSEPQELKPLAFGGTTKVVPFPVEEYRFQDFPDLLGNGLELLRLFVFVPRG